MDVCESESQGIALDTVRPPLVPAQSNSNAAAAAATTRRPRTREVSSRYKSPSPTTPSGPRRFPSPKLTRSPTPSQLVPKRSLSVERRRPSAPPSPPSPSTPAHDSSIDMQLPSRRLSTGSRLEESLWPSTMRSLSVSFQSDTISIPVGKKEKPVNNVFSDRTLRPSSNVAHRPAETPIGSRKPAPERKRSPLKRKNTQGQSENAKPADGLHARLIDQHRWPSSIGGKASSNSLNKSVNLSDKTVMILSTYTGIGLSSRRRTPIPDGGVKPLQKAANDAARLSSLHEIRRAGSEVKSVDDDLMPVSGAQRLPSTSTLERTSPQILASTSILERTSFYTPAARSQSLSAPGSRPSSPSRMSASKGVSPSRTRPSTPPSRGVSPSRIRSSSVSSQSNSSTSVLSFIADFRKGKKAASCIEEAHQLRLLYNRHLQWRFANARADAVLSIQKLTAEKTLYNVWNMASALWDSVVKKRINLQQLKLVVKLNAILNDQMAYLDDWILLERDHIDSLSGAVEDLEASTLHLPMTGGAKADIESLKLAIFSALDVMQAMGSSICSLLSRVEGINSLVSELAVIAARERAMLAQCKALLASKAAMQVEEYSIRTHLIQMEQAVEKQPILAMKTPRWP